MTNTIEKIKQLEDKKDTYTPRKISPFIEELKYLSKDITFDKEDAIKFIMKNWISKITPVQGKPINDCLDEQLTKKDKVEMLNELKNVVYFVPTFYDKIHEKLFNVYRKIVKVVDCRFKEDFPTVSYKIENKYELDTKRNAEIVRNCIMTEPEIINKLGELADKKLLKEKEAQKYLSKFNLKVQMVEKKNKLQTVVYFTNEKDEEMYDSNVYVMNIYNTKITLAYKQNLSYNCEEVVIDTITRPVEVAYEMPIKQQELKGIVENVNKQVRKINKYKIDDNKLNKLREIIKSKINEQKRYVKADEVLNEIGCIANNIKRNKINIDLVKNTVLKVIDIIFKKDSVEYKVVDSIKLKSERSNKLKANVKYYMTNNTAIVYVEKKNDVDYYEIDVVETSMKGNTKKAKEMRSKREKGFKFAVTTEDRNTPVMYFKTKREAIKNIKKYVEKIA